MKIIKIYKDNKKVKIGDKIKILPINQFKKAVNYTTDYAYLSEEIFKVYEVYEKRIRCHLSPSRSIDFYFDEFELL